MDCGITCAAASPVNNFYLELAAESNKKFAKDNGPQGMVNGI